MVDTLIRHANLLFTSNNYKSDLENHILRAENSDKEYHIFKEMTTKNEQNQVQTYFNLNKKGMFLHKNRLYIPNIAEINLAVMNELHKQPYLGHPGYQKMITMIKKGILLSKHEERSGRVLSPMHRMTAS